MTMKSDERIRESYTSALEYEDDISKLEQENKELRGKIKELESKIMDLEVELGNISMGV